MKEHQVDGVWPVLVLKQKVRGQQNKGDSRTVWLLTKGHTQTSMLKQIRTFFPVSLKKGIIEGLQTERGCYVTNNT